MQRVILPPLHGRPSRPPDTTGATTQSTFTESTGVQMFRSVSFVRVGAYLAAAALVAAFQLGFAPAAFAQAASASISGTIADTQGGVLPGVTVTATNADNGTVHTSVSEADGKYRVPGLAPGKYNVKAELPGFQTVEVTNITLVINQEYSHDFQLGL